MNSELNMNSSRQLMLYVIGFIGSIALTVAAYFAVVNHWVTGNELVLTVFGLGILQAIVQLVFFLHLGQEAKPRWNLIHFLFMTMILVILIGGSLWIMYHLDYRVMPMKEHL